MNYNEEMAQLFDELGLQGQFELVEIAEEDKATPADYLRLEERIRLRCDENENRFRSSECEQNYLPCLLSSSNRETSQVFSKKNRLKIY